MFEIGDRVNVNLGANGTHKGTIDKVFNPPRGNEYYSVRTDEAFGPLLIDSTIANPWDLFLIDDEESN